MSLTAPTNDSHLDTDDEQFSDDEIESDTTEVRMVAFWQRLLSSTVTCIIMLILVLFLVDSLLS